MSLNFKYLSEVSRQDASFILENFLPIPKNAVTLLSASGGTGKTRLALLMADRHIRNTGENVALWLTEDYAGQVKATFEDMVEAGLADTSSMNKMLLILNDPPQLAKREQGLFKANYEAINELGKTLILQGVTFAIFDPLLAFYGGNENDNSEARVFIQTFATWANNAEITSLIIHHSNKDGHSRGATAFHDGVRARYELVKPTLEDGEINADLTNKGFRVAVLKKDNWGIVKPLWKLSEGQNELMLKVMPSISNPFNVEVTEYSHD